MLSNVKKAALVIFIICCAVTCVKPRRKVPSAGPFIKQSNLVVRGYVGVAVGKSGEAEKSGYYNRNIPSKFIFLPGVDVYLESQKTAKTSGVLHTDLSGRFTLNAPERGTYRLCWKAAVYGGGCTPYYIKVGASPVFLSRVSLQIPPKHGFSAIVGKVTDQEGSTPRLYEPLFNVNAFATVALQENSKKNLAEVYVNNFGDYLIPYAPVKTPLRLTAKIEGAKFSQEIYPEAPLETSRLHHVNLKFTNHRPHLDPLFAVDGSGKGVQNAAPGTVLKLAARARDDDGDDVRYAWMLDEGGGSLSSSTAEKIKWTLPDRPGRWSVTLVAFDGKGGYDKTTLAVLATGEGVPFTGVVVTPSGTPIAGAQIEIVGNPPVQTGSGGRFSVVVKPSDRYVFNIRKTGFALNSQIYDHGMTSGRWTLWPAQTITVDPTRKIRLTNERSQKNCPGPDSRTAGLGPAGKSLLKPQFQDGKGHTIDAGELERGRDERKLGYTLPRALRLSRCGPGVQVEIPANSIVDQNEQPVKGPIRVSLSTVDLLSGNQMPGDDSVVTAGGRGGNIESFGAGILDLPPGYKLKDGTTAKITIPVDRSRLIGGEPLPPTIPYLSYDETKGLWEEQGVLTLKTVNGVKSYVGTTTHFSAFNADNVKTDDAACLRVFSPTLPGQYDLEVTAPLGGNGPVKILKKPIDQTATGFEHVIYNLPSHTNITLAPMTQGNNPELLGYFVVNSGPPQDPNNAPNVPPGPPYESCKNFVVLKMGQAPGSPFGGEFLHGIGFIDAANIGFDDLTSANPTGNDLRDKIIEASRAYYLSVDPSSSFDNLEKFKNEYGFLADPNQKAPGEITAQYANSGDLGFGRDMHCIKKANGNVGCYVSNYGTGYVADAPGAGTGDQDDADAAGSRAQVGQSKEVATVAMEYSPIENAGLEKVVKFYVYKKDFPNQGDYGRSISANLDGRGERPVPQLCMICHGGQVQQYDNANHVPLFGSADAVRLNSRFLPFDHRFFTFPGNDPNLDKDHQEQSFKDLNQIIVNATTPAGNDPIKEVIQGMYDDGTPNGADQQIYNFTVPGWANGQPPAAAGQSNFYQKVFANNCRICHIAQPYAQLQFNTADKFINLQTGNGVLGGANNKLMLGTAQMRVCGDYTMPHALRTHEIFWDVYWDVLNWGAPPSPASQDFQTFGNGIGGGTWQPGLCTSFISNLGASPSNFYEQAIQPIFNGKCVGCHINGGQAAFMALTEGDSFVNLLNGRVVPGNDNPAAPGNKLLGRTTAAAPGFGRMPPNCYRAPAEQPNGNLPCLTDGDIGKIKAWIRSGAN